MKEKKTILQKNDIERKLKRMALQISEENNGLENVCFIGIERRGVPMAKFMADFLKKVEKIDVPIGILDIKFYNDDLTKVNEKPVIYSNRIHFFIDNLKVILVDDVLYTGKTVQTAMNAIYSLGTPQNIQLCVLIDRGHHEIPIKADFVGEIVPTSKNEIIKVNLTETDGEENVKIMVT